MKDTFKLWETLVVGFGFEEEENELFVWVRMRESHVGEHNV